jgi:MFS family permease
VSGNPITHNRDLDSPYAWRMAGVAFVICFVIFGVVYSFGAFFKPLATEFGADRAGTSALFAITGAIYNVLGLVGGRLTDRFGPRGVMLTGSVAFGLGLIATAAAPTLRFAYLAYGLGLGIGVGCTYVPALAIVGGWFARSRSTAMGVAVSGIGAGTLAVAPLAASLIARWGWRETYLLMGVASMALLAICALLAAAPPIASSSAAPPISRQVRTPQFLMLYLAALLCSVSIYVPFVYLPDFAQSRGINGVAAAALVGFVGAASLVGRLSFGAIANRTGILNLYKGSLLVLGLSYATWPIAHSYAMLAAFAVIMGSAYGGMVSLSPTVVAEIFGAEGLGTMLGALYTGIAVSSLVGPPAVGFAIDHGGTYLWAAIIAGGAGVLSFIVMLPLREGRVILTEPSAHPAARTVLVQPK